MNNRTRKILTQFVRRADEVLASRFVVYLNENGSGLVPTPVPLTTTEQRIAFLLDFRYFVQGTEGLGIFGTGRELTFLRVLSDAALSDRFRSEVKQDIGEAGEYLDSACAVVPETASSRLPTNRDILYTALYGRRACLSTDREPAYREWHKAAIADAAVDENLSAVLRELSAAIHLLRQRCHEELLARTSPPRLI